MSKSEPQGDTEATNEENLLHSLRHDNFISPSPLLGTRASQRAVVHLGSRVSMSLSPREGPSDGPSPKKVSPSKSCPRKRHSTSPSPVPAKRPSISPRSRRCSWRRSSLKGGKRRKSLPPIYQDVTELCKDISLQLPESERLALLIQSAFQFAVQKCRKSLENVEGFDEQDFETDVSSVSNELKFLVEKMKRDGTLQKCTEEPTEAPLDPAEEEFIAQLKEQNARFCAECRDWEQLLQTYENKAEAMERQLKHGSINGIRVPCTVALESSQSEVIRSKPDYAAILAGQSEVFDSIETALDEVKQCVHLVKSFTKDSEQYLRTTSECLASRAFKQLEDSPLQKCLRLRKKE